ncbi:MAG: hypothetical protein CME04_00415 [Gemmatimonadaceae bacterium]|jgi:hypothetical protein|nr:hypothetical protein [Gemmatimonadaceae bacterium]|tara:strand:- start:752 stop:1309 length:558 start_codon:yes stop_codon:yes gene_type:complete
MNPTPKSWKLWFQEIVGRFLSVHFVITLLLVGFWLWSLTGPLNALNALYPKLTDSQSSEAAVGAIEAVEKSAGIVSALFTTVIGVVLGHYFGQRGVERAENAQAHAEKLREEVADDFVEDGEALLETVEDLGKQLDLRDDALLQAVELLEERSVEIDSGSPLASLLTEVEVEAEDDDDQEEADDE